jgi:hypothetical protein
MSKVLDLVTKSTLALIWLQKEPSAPTSELYRDVDYLLDGLLTSSLRDTQPKNQVLMARNFGRPLYVVVLGSVVPVEIKNLMELAAKDLHAESEILVIDEIGGSKDLEKLLPPNRMKVFA